MRGDRTSFVGLMALLAVTAVAQEKRVPPGTPGTVTLPLAEYDLLVERAARPPDPPERAPVAAVLSSATLALRVDGGAVRGAMEIEGEAFRPGAVRLFDGAGLLDATQDGRPVPLRVERTGHFAMITRPGPLRLSLAWADEVAAEPGRVSFTVPVPPAGTARATIDLPGPDLDARVAPGAVTRRSSASGRTVLEVALQPGAPARVTWTVRESAAVSVAPRERRFLSDLKTLVTTAEADLRLTTLVDLTIVQGDADPVDVKLPPGFELLGVSGATLEASQPAPGGVRLTLRDPARRRHQLLLTLERSSADGSFQADLTLPTLPGAQRETGEVALEGVGALELLAREAGSLRRIDVSEAAPPLRALAREPVLAAFRYHRRPDETPALSIEVKRFPNAPVLAALAERASATTLVTVEGRTLTELALTVRNQAQPFLRVSLPAGATLLSAEVAGQGVKPVTGADGTRIPLLRPGFRPRGPYAVSFVYLQPGTPFAKKGDTALALPRLDVPVSVLEWEVFLPDRYRVKATGGDVLPSAGVALGDSTTLSVGGLAETVSVSAEALAIDLAYSRKGEPQAVAPSANVLNLQKRVAGVLPVRLDVPHAGTSYRFFRPLVVDEETTVRFAYKRR